MLFMDNLMCIGNGIGSLVPQNKVVVNFAVELQFHPAPGSKRSSNLQKCTNADVQLRTPDDGQKGCPKYVDS